MSFLSRVFNTYPQPVFEIRNSRIQELEARIEVLEEELEEVADSYCEAITDFELIKLQILELLGYQLVDQD